MNSSRALQHHGARRVMPTTAFAASGYNVAFGTVPLTLAQWFVCAGMASGVLWLRELRKWITRAIAPLHTDALRGA